MKHSTVIICICAATYCMQSAILAGSAPTISPGGDQTTLVDASGTGPDGGQIELTASGGDCDPPDDGCNWEKDGDVYYVWEYTDTDDDPVNGLSADPASDQDPEDGNGDTLTIDLSQGGYSTITVYAKQKWKQSDGGNMESRSVGRTYHVRSGNTSTDDTDDDRVTTSPAGNGGTVSIQVPDNLQFISGSPDAGGSSAAYKFQIYDQLLEPIANNGWLILDESDTFSTDVTSNGTFVVHLTSTAPITGGAAQGTDGEGYIVDTPVGFRPSEILYHEILLNEQLSYDSIFDHNYPDINLAVPYVPHPYTNAHFHGNQHIKQDGIGPIPGVTASITDPRSG